MDQGPPKGFWTPKIREHHVITRFHLDGRVMHRMRPGYGKALVIHSPEHTPECKICIALGLDGKENHGEGNGEDRIVGSRS